MSRVSTGLALRWFRKRAKLTLGHVSFRTGLTMSKLSRIENGQTDISLSDTYSILNAISVEFDEFKARVDATPVNGSAHAAEALRGHIRTLRLAGRNDGMVEDMEKAADILERQK